MTLAPPSPTPALQPLELPWDLRLNADASLVRLDRWQALSPEQRRGFAPRRPDLVLDLAPIWDG